MSANVFTNCSGAVQLQEHVGLEGVLGPVDLKKIVKILSYISVSGSDSSWICKIRKIRASHEIVMSLSQFHKIFGFINLLTGWNNQSELNYKSEFSRTFLNNYKKFQVPCLFIWCFLVKKNQSIWLNKKQENSGFVDSEVVVGSNEIYIKKTYLEITETSAQMHPMVLNKFHHFCLLHLATNKVNTWNLENLLNDWISICQCEFCAARFHQFFKIFLDNDFYYCHNQFTCQWKTLSIKNML